MYCIVHLKIDLKGRFQVSHFFPTVEKNFSSEHLNLSLSHLGTKKSLPPREVGQITRLAVEDKPALSDGKSKFSLRAHKARARLHEWWTYRVS